MKRDDRYDSMIQWYAEQNDMDWLLLKAQIKAESNFDPMARSSAGAMGLAQFMPATFLEWSNKLMLKEVNPFNPEYSIRCQSAYMRWLCDQFPGELERAIAAYNFGVGREQRRDPWPTETVNYVKRIKVYLADYQAAAGVV